MSSIKYKETITGGRKEAVADAIAAAGELTEELRDAMKIVKDAAAIPIQKVADIPIQITDMILLFYQITRQRIWKKFHSHSPKSFMIRQKAQLIWLLTILMLIITSLI